MLLGESIHGGAALPAPAEPENPLAPRQPHFAPKAKRVIHLFMAGRPSQLDLFDYKPELAQLEGKPLPPSVIWRPALCLHPVRRRRARPAVQVRPARPMRRGSLSEMLPHLARRRRRHLHHQVGAHRSVQSRAGPDLLEHGLLAAGPAEPRIVGHCTDWAPSRRTCRRSS